LLNISSRPILSLRLLLKIHLDLDQIYHHHLVRDNFVFSVYKLKARERKVDLTGMGGLRELYLVLGMMKRRRQLEEAGQELDSSEVF